MILEKDKWYKFDPYHKDWSTTWYMKSTGKSFEASKYLNKSTKTSIPKLRNVGYFSDYSRDGSSYVEITGVELLWIKAIEELGKYFPFPEFRYDRVINDYNIF